MTYDGIGAESALTTCLDPLSLNLISFPSRHLLANAQFASLYPADPAGQAVSSFSGSSTTLSFGSIVPIVLTVPVWTVLRTGSLGTSITDTWDVATNFVNAITAGGGSPAQGQVYRARICNQTSLAETITPGTGITASTFTISAGSCMNFALDITNAGSPAVTIVGK